MPPDAGEPACLQHMLRSAQESAAPDELRWPDTQLELLLVRPLRWPATTTVAPAAT
eukprot:COSAG06_NODE_52502_length_305_cov_0.757282_1_plen_55_part_01